MNNRIKLVVMTLIPFGLMACGSSSDDNNDQAYEIQMVNLTNNQPLSPVALIAHTSGYSAFNDGEVASLALETLAEGGDNAPLIVEAEQADEYITHATTTGPIGPKSTGTLNIQVPNGDAEDLRLTMVSMLVNTNDAFTGLDEADISSIEAGATMTLTGFTWDSGTELNTEASGTMPGPADGGIGFEATRDDTINLVRFHAGVVTADDGLTSSVLDESHRFLNPTSRIIITRTR